jgi:hypothetical protein
MTGSITLIKRAVIGAAVCAEADIKVRAYVKIVGWSCKVKRTVNEAVRSGDP